MSQDLRTLFEREFDAEPPLAAGLAGDAIHRGTRLRRRRHLTVLGGAAAGVLMAVATAAALGLPAQPNTPAPTQAHAAVGGCPNLVRTVPLDRNERDRREVAIFLRADITEGQRRSLAAALDASPLLESVHFESREEAFSKFQDLWRDSPDLVRSVQPGQLPESFRVVLADPREHRAFIAGIGKHPGVEDIVHQTAVDCPSARTGEGE